MQGLNFYTLKDGCLHLKKKLGPTEKKYISKKDFDYFYIENRKARSDLQKMGVGSKTFLNSYHLHYPKKEDRKIIRGNKVRLSQRGANNSNAKNWGKPRKLLDKILLKNMIESGLSLGKICTQFKCSEPTVNSNIKYHKLKTWVSRKLHGNSYIAVKQLEKLTGLDFEKKLSDARTDKNVLINLVKQAEIDVQNCKETLQRIRGSYLLGASHIPKSRYERYTRQILDDLNIVYVPQFKIDNYYFDFLLADTNTLLECDGEGHCEEGQVDKEKSAKDYKLIRIDFSSLRSKKQCFQAVRSAVLKVLE